MSVQLQEQAGAIGVRRLAGNIGAQITGVDIARPLAPEAVAGIRQALLAHKVIFFRDQHLDHASQIAFARHRFLAGYKPSAGDSPLAQRINANLLVSNHPVVRVHPETGEEALFVNPGFTDHILGVSAVESRRILDLLFEQIARPDYTVRFHWQPGSVAFWDNRATAHLGPTDLGHLNVERVLHRVTLIGDWPVGPAGFTSEIVEGKPFLSDADVKVG
jgi:alpha-ketoglutarate-dependent taurine dioxygenase